MPDFIRDYFTLLYLTKLIRNMRQKYYSPQGTHMKLPRLIKLKFMTQDDSG